MHPFVNDETMVACKRVIFRFQRTLKSVSVFPSAIDKATIIPVIAACLCSLPPLCKFSFLLILICCFRNEKIEEFAKTVRDSSQVSK